jgi:hypothetical protein
MRLAVIFILVSALIPSVSPTQEVPVSAITPAESTIKFDEQRHSFIKIANRVEVTVALQAKRISGPPVVFKQ